jgi:putative ABC transport system ATP-binding protein
MSQLRTTAATPIVRVEGVTKIYGSGEAATVALDGVWLEIRRGSFTAVMGPSGSGKTTLLQIIAGLDTPTSGRVFLGDREVSAMSEAQLTELRRHEIGFIFQAHNLLPTLTTKENILLPLVIAGKRPDFGWFHRVIGAVGLEKVLERRPFQLSQGQQQRVATARALITRPSLVLADEPTGNLDSRASRELLTFLSDTMKGFSQTVVMVTHDTDVAGYAERVISISDGKVVGDSAVDSLALPSQHTK